MTRFLITTAAATLLTATTAVANVTIDDLDMDNDGFATEAEVNAMYPDLLPIFFDEIDSNDDNRLSSQEIQDGEAQGIFERAASTPNEVNGDLNGDGYISYEEMTTVVPGFSQRDFDRIDGNDDNRLSQAEILEPGVSGIIAGERGTDTALNLETWDADGDMFLTYEELLVGWPELPQVGFDEIDENADNRLSENEFSAPGTSSTLNMY